MKEIKAIPITKDNFAKFGRYYNLYEETKMFSEDFELYMFPHAFIDEPVNLGMTMVKCGDFNSISMERHVLTEEVLFCGDAEMVLTVADSDSEYVPQSADVEAFIMKPGDVAVLGLGIWHDANHGVDKETLYYFLATNKDPGPNSRETEWVKIEPTPVHVRVK